MAMVQRQPTRSEWPGGVSKHSCRGGSKKYNRGGSASRHRVLQKHRGTGWYMVCSEWQTGRQQLGLGVAQVVRLFG